MYQVNIYQWIMNRIRLVYSVIMNRENYGCQPGHCPFWLPILVFSDLEGADML